MFVLDVFWAYPLTVKFSKLYVTNGKLLFDKNERILRHYPSAAGMHEIVLRKVLLDN